MSDLQQLCMALSMGTMPMYHCMIDSHMKWVASVTIHSHYYTAEGTTELEARVRSLDSAIDGLSKCGPMPMYSYYPPQPPQYYPPMQPYYSGAPVITTHPPSPGAMGSGYMMSAPLLQVDGKQEEPSGGGLPVGEEPPSLPIRVLGPKATGERRIMYWTKPEDEGKTDPP